jgi:hypothetical protein
MKRIVLLACVMLLMVASTAEARRRSSGSYVQPVRVAPVVNSTLPAKPAQVVPVSHSTPTVQPVKVAAAVHSTKTAQGVANIMASYGTVGHWGGNPGYEGCGMGATPEAGRDRVDGLGICLASPRTDRGASFLPLTPPSTSMRSAPFERWTFLAKRGQ